MLPSVQTEKEHLHQPVQGSENTTKEEMEIISEMKEGGEVMGNASFWAWVIYCPHKLMGVVITA